MNLYSLFIHYFDEENSNNFDLLLRFLIFILLKKNFPRFVSIFSFIKIFKIKGITSSVEEYFIHAVEKAYETIYMEFNFNVNNSIRIDSNRLKDLLFEYNKNDLINKNFKSASTMTIKGK